MTINLFCGWDPREAVGFSVFAHSVISRASRQVRITPISNMGLPEGSNSFTLSRFLVPWMMDFRGRAIFLDGADMLCLADIAELDALFDPRKAVQVVQHAPYMSLHNRKYVGTEMECQQRDYVRKNWASAMVLNCAHPAWHGLTLSALTDTAPIDMLQFRKLDDSEIGALPAEWNCLVDEGQDHARAKVLHWTAGIPAFAHYRDARGSKTWFEEFDAMCGGKSHG